MKRLLNFVFIFSFVIAQSAFAETPIGQQPTAAPVSTMPQGANVNDTAKKASGSAGSAMIANGIAAAGFIAAAIAAPPPQKPIYYALAAAAVAAGMMMGGGKGNANAIDKATYGAPSAGGGYNGVTAPGAGYETGDGSYVDLPALEAQLKEAGYVMSADGSTLSTPNGTVSTAAIASGKAPGFEMTDDVKSAMDDIAADATAKASGNRVVPVGLQDGGGGGGGGGGFAQADDSSSKFDMNKYLRGLKNRDPSSVSGLSKKLGDDNIGIKSDNIFEMVSRQYKRKESQSAFIK